MPSDLPRRPVLAGNNKAAVEVLELMLQLWDATEILVVAPPRGPQHSWQPSLAGHAATRGVEVVGPDDVNEGWIVDALRDRASDLLLSVYYTQIFSTSLLDVIHGPRLNFHPSLLPRHRGTAPLIWAIAEGDTQTGVSVHELTVGVDTGPILWQRPLPIHQDDTGYSLHLKAAALVRAIASDLLRRLQLGRDLPDPVAQSGNSTVHTSRDPQLNRIDWSQPDDRIRNIVRALAWPLPGAETSWGECLDRCGRSDRDCSRRPEPGTWA